MIVTHVSCSWCHELNLVDQLFCRICGHRSDLSRSECDCPRCLAWLNAVRRTETITVKEGLL